MVLLPLLVLLILLVLIVILVFVLVVVVALVFVVAESTGRVCETAGRTRRGGILIIIISRKGESERDTGGYQ